MGWSCVVDVIIEPIAPNVASRVYHVKLWSQIIVLTECRNDDPGAMTELFRVMALGEFGISG